MTTLRTTVIILMALVCAGCNRNDSRMLPRQLEGTWTTDDPRYQDRFMDLSQAFVIIGTSRYDAPSVQLIDKVEVEARGSDTVLTVYSTDHSQSAHYQMAIQFSPANGGEIRFKNQTQVWRRREDTTN